MNRPPLGRLLHRRTKALAFYLTAVYVAHLEARPGHAFENKRGNVTGEGSAWARLAGFTTSANEAAWRESVRRALRQLSAAELVFIPSEHGDRLFERWKLLSDDGSNRSYTVPGEKAKEVLALPASFFYNGWHLVLEPAEIAVLLALLDSGRDERGAAGSGAVSVELSRRARLNHYGISDEVYPCVRELHEYGIVQSLEKGAGKESSAGLIPQPFSLPDLQIICSQDAFEAVHGALERALRADRRRLERRGNSRL
jgi:hypothetical protein